MENYTFSKEYKITVGSKNADPNMSGSVPYAELNFKVGDVIQGTLSEDKKAVVTMPRPNAFVNIPIDYFQPKNNLTLENLPIKAPINNVTIQNNAIANVFDRKTAEDKLYEKFGVKYNNTHMFGVSSRIFPRLVIISIICLVGFGIYKNKK